VCDVSPPASSNRAESTLKEGSTEGGESGLVLDRKRFIDPSIAGREKVPRRLGQAWENRPAANRELVDSTRSPDGLSIAPQQKKIAQEF